MPANNHRQSIIITSFGYKSQRIIQANMLFDVRFLDNPFWEPTLRDLTGLDFEVKNYVLNQVSAQEFITDVLSMLTKQLDKIMLKLDGDFILAIGCTGGQHRSVAIVETLATQISQKFPDFNLIIKHRELHLEKKYNPVDVK